MAKKTKAMTEETTLSDLAAKLYTIQADFVKLQEYIQTLKDVAKDNTEALEELKTMSRGLLCAVYDAKTCAVKSLHPDILCGCYPTNEADIMLFLSGIQEILEDQLKFAFWPEAEKFLAPLKSKDDEEAEYENNEKPQPKKGKSDTLYEHIQSIYENHSDWGFYLSGLSTVADKIAGIVAKEQADSDEPKGQLAYPLEKSKKIVQASEQERRFKPWKNPGDARFVVEGNRIKFYYNGQLHNINLKYHNHAHKLLKWLNDYSEITSAQIKGHLNIKYKACHAVRNINNTLNHILQQLNIELPDNIKFIAFDNKDEHYFSLLPI